MGVVYEARQVRLNRLVAIKMIRAGAFATEAEVQRFQNEAEAVAQLDHPRIVPIHEVGKIGDCHYFSMKLIRGGSLAHRLDAFRSDTRAAARIVIEVARGIQHAHERGILHRDLKPGNILLDEHDQPQVTDFGLAKRFGDDSSLTQSGAILGTPSYMAPEQAAGRKGSDHHAHRRLRPGGGACTPLLTGHAPFVAETVIETIEQVRQRPPVPPSRLNPQVEPGPGDDLPEVPGEGADQAVCLGRGAGRRPPALARRPADRGAARERQGTGLDVVPPQSDRGRPAGGFRAVRGRGHLAVAACPGACYSKAQIDASSTAIDRALALCDQGKVSSGMLRLAKVLETAPRERR